MFGYAQKQNYNIKNGIIIQKTETVGAKIFLSIFIPTYTPSHAYLRRIVLF